MLRPPVNEGGAMRRYEHGYSRASARVSLALILVGG